MTNSLLAPSFNGSLLTEYVKTIHANDQYIRNGIGSASKGEETGGKVFKWYNEHFFNCFNPDITGYVICFMVTPPFLGLKNDNATNQYVKKFRKLITFAATQFTPPRTTLHNEKTSARTGGIPYATEVAPTNSCNVTYIDNYDLDIYNFHSIWIEYVHALLEGYIEPPAVYYTNDNDSQYGGLDYAGSLFFVKYDPSFHHIKYVGKATGIFPESLPSQAILGQRTTNEVTTLPFTYTCAFYNETVNPHHAIWIDLENKLYSAFNDL